MKLSDLLIFDHAAPVKTVAVPFADDPEVMACIGNAIRMKLANFILIGQPARIQSVAAAHDANLSLQEIIHEENETAACDLAASLVHEGRAHIMLKGRVQSSSYLRGILNRKYSLVNHDSLISVNSVFELPMYHKLLIVTDPGVNIEPTLLEKEAILANAIGLARQMGIDVPKAACIDAVEKVNQKIPSTVDANTLKERCLSGSFGKADVDGPLSFDIAISKQAAEIKLVHSSVAGDPDILLFPNIVAANAIYKCFIWFCKGVSASIVTGAKIPIVLTSRSDSEETKLYSLALAVRLASQQTH